MMDSTVDNATISSAQRTQGYLGLSFVVTALLAMLLVFLIDQAPAHYATVPWLGLWHEFALVGLVGGVVLIFALPLPERLRFDLLPGLLALFFVGILALTLKNTPFTVGGYNGDARLYVASVTKMAAYPGYADLFYHSFPAFYPPLYFYLLGNAAWWFGIEPYLVMKPALLVFMTLFPFLTAWLWRRVIDPRWAIAPAFLMLVVYQWFRPHEWLALVIFFPWWLHWVEGIGRPTNQTKLAQIGWWVAGGLIGAISFQLYFFWFFLGGAKLVGQLVIDLWRGVPRPQIGRCLQLSVGMLLLTALISSPYWAPYLWSMAETGGWKPLQNRFLTPRRIPIPLPFLESTWAGVAMAGGLLYLLMTTRRLWLSRALGAFVLATYAWILLGLVGILLDMPLQTYRAYPVLDYLLALALLIFLLRLWLDELTLPPFLQAVDVRRTLRMLAAAALIGFILFFGREVVIAVQTEENVQDAITATYPAEKLARYDTLTGGQYVDKEVWLSNHYIDMLIFRPIYSFTAWSAYYSHPAGRFRQRIDFLEELATVQSPQLFATALMNNQYSSTIDYILLRPEPGHWRFAFVDDNFPNRVISRNFHFADRLFADPYFTAHQAQELTLFRPVYAENPFASLQADAANENPEAIAQLYTLAATFTGDLQQPPTQEERTAYEAYLLTADLTRLSVPTLLDLHRASTDELHERSTVALGKQLGLATPVTLVDPSGQPVMRALGYTLTPQSTDEYELTLYWEMLAPVSEGYTIWLHLYHDEEQFNFDHQPLLSTSKWQPGVIYADQTTVTLTPGEYDLRFGLWLPDVDQRLMQPDGAFGINIEKVRVN